MSLGKAFEYVCDLDSNIKTISCALAHMRRWEFHVFTGMDVTGEITVESLKGTKIVPGRAVWMEG